MLNAKMPITCHQLLPVNRENTPHSVVNMKIFLGQSFILSVFPVSVTVIKNSKMNFLQKFRRRSRKREKEWEQQNISIYCRKCCGGRRYLDLWGARRRGESYGSINNGRIWF